jgi:hypothetical protein
MRAIKSFGGVRDIAEAPPGPRQHGKLCRSTRSPVPGEPPEKVAGTLEAATGTEKGRGRGAGAFLAQVRSGCGAGARHLAVVACRRSGCRFQGKGMNEHLVANVARWDRPVENWRHRFCSRAPLSLLGLEANCRERRWQAPTDVGFCGFAILPGGSYPRWQRQARGAALDNGKGPRCAQSTRSAIIVACIGWNRSNLIKRWRRPHDLGEGSKPICQWLGAAQLQVLRERRDQCSPRPSLTSI